MTNFSQASEIKPCDFCEDPVLNFCRDCKNGLCKICTANHFLLKPSIVHDIVPFRYGTGSTRFSPQCACLSSEIPVLYCFDCLFPFCTACKHIHESHLSGCISENIHVLVQLLQEQNLELMNNIIPWSEASIDIINVKRTELSSRYEKLQVEINTQRDLLHKCLDDHFDGKLETLREMETQHLEKLSNELEKYRKQKEFMIGILKRNKGILGSFRMLQKGKPQQIFKSLKVDLYPKFEELKMPSFVTDVTVENIRKKLSDFAGSLVQGSLLSSYLTPPPRKTFLSEKPMSVPKQITVFPIEFYGGDVACERGGTVWICGLGSRHIMQYDIKGGKTGNIISVTSQPSFLSLNSKGHLFYTEFRDESVKCVTHKIPETFVKNKGWQPRGIHCCLNDDVLVSEYSEELKHSRIVRYNSAGACLTILEYGTSQQKPLFDNVLFLCENKNGDIGLTERIKATVVVIGKNGRKRFQYSGHIRFSNFDEFEFAGISSDSRCNYVISDPKNRTLHVIDWQGKFLFYVMPGKLVSPMAVCVDDEDRAWVSEARGSIQVLTYMDNDTV